MTRLEDLVESLCPSGIKFKALIDVCTIETGKLNANESEEAGQYPFFTTAKEQLRINKYRWDEEAILIAGNANVGEVKYYKGKFEAYQRTYVLTRFHDELIVKFLYYFFQSNLIQYLENKKNTSAMTYIVLSTLQNFEIPLPPIEVQQEIVRILDAFTTLEAELKVELESRSYQYRYYMNKLMKFNENTQFLTLDKVAKISNGRDHKHLGDGEFPVYGSGGVMRYADSYIYSEESVLIPRKGSIGNIFYVNSPFWTVDTIFYTKINIDLIEPKFFYYYLKTLHLEDLNIAGGVPSLTKTTLDKIKIPVPSLTDQRIVIELLDHFDTLINSTSNGLPAEIAARRKQYEYYRNKLLTFKEANHEPV